MIIICVKFNVSNWIYSNFTLSSIKWWLFHYHIILIILTDFVEVNADFDYDFEWNVWDCSLCIELWLMWYVCIDIDLYITKWNLERRVNFGKIFELFELWLYTILVINSSICFCWRWAIHFKLIIIIAIWQYSNYLDVNHDHCYLKVCNLSKCDCIMIPWYCVIILRSYDALYHTNNFESFPTLLFFIHKFFLLFYW